MLQAVKWSLLQCITSIFRLSPRWMWCDMLMFVNVSNKPGSLLLVLKVNLFQSAAFSFVPRFRYCQKAEEFWCLSEGIGNSGEAWSAGLRAAPKPGGMGAQGLLQPLEYWALYSQVLILVHVWFPLYLLVVKYSSVTRTLLKFGSCGKNFPPPSSGGCVLNRITVSAVSLRVCVVLKELQAV